MPQCGLTLRPANMTGMDIHSIDLRETDGQEAGLKSPGAGLAFSLKKMPAITGTTSATSVLEAMICHSDDTATDVALKAVGAEAVREFIARAGLASAKIPTSTRVLVSYLAGAPAGVDVGLAGMQKIMGDRMFGAPRSPMLFFGAICMPSTVGA